MSSPPAKEPPQQKGAPRDSDRQQGDLWETRRAMLNLLEDLDAERLALQQAEQEWRVAFDGVRDAIFLHDAELRIIRCNAQYAALAGLPQEQLVGRPYWQVFPKRDRPLPGCVEKKPVELEFTVGDTLFRSRAYTVADEQGCYRFSVHIMEDVTERRRMEARLRFMAQHDALTSLPNRSLFVELLELELAQARRRHRKVAVLFFDLDKFKNINDTLGHDVGDQLLKAVAARLRETVRGSDTVARIGGDEFNIILPDLERPELAGEVAGHIVEAFQRPFIVAGRTLSVTTSIGISLFPDDGESGEALSRYADMAMYEAKDQGRNTFRYYNLAINLRSRERMRIESSLHQALERGELRLLYQPKLDLRANRIVGAEALVRWQHPELGLLLPGRFIPVAEETGLITAIDDWVLGEVCRQVRSWVDQGLAPLGISVNLSARQFQKADLIEKIDRLLAHSCLSPEWLELELTEWVVMSHIDQALPCMQALAARGLHITVDDFGTGYSSLNYLKRLPIERLKIDKSFVRDIATDPDDRAIVQAVTALAHSLNKQVIAEGVESEEQLAFLRGIDCDQAQGFFFHHPLPPDRFQQLLTPAQ